MKPILEILPQEQRALYPHLAQITGLGFVLFGGTAIALQLGHRQSVDFDFFTHKSIDRSQKTLLTLKDIKVGTILQQEKDTLVFMTESKVKLSFFGDMDFVSKAKATQTDDGILRIADMQSLLATKLKATCDRAEYKDYFDIATILRQTDISLKNALNDVGVFFGSDFPLVQILKGLTYFDDGDLHRLTEQDKKLLIKESKEASQWLSAAYELQAKFDRVLGNIERTSDEKQREKFLQKAESLCKEAQGKHIRLDSKRVGRLDKYSKRIGINKDKGLGEE